MVFGDLKYKDEYDYDPSVHRPLSNDDLNEENMKAVVKIIFKKA
jgi:hypothetical protein